jgi:hypothetical protein
MTTTLDLMERLRDSLTEREITPAPTVGVHPNTPMELYQRWEAASNSRLSQLLRSPAHLHAYLNEPPEDATALRIGRAVHTAILEPDLFTSQFVVATTCGATVKKTGQPCTNDGKYYHLREGWVCGVHAKGLDGPYDESRIALSPSDYATCVGARDSVHVGYRAAARLLGGDGSVELSAVWSHGDVRCKGRFDRHSPSIAGGAIVDLKSTTNASRREFERSIFSYGYFRQGAFYLRGAQAVGIPAEHFVIIAVEKTPPYAVGVYRLTEGAIDAGEQQLAPLLRRYAECMSTGIYPGYPDRVEDIALPDWGWKVVDESLTTFGTDYEATP